MCGYWKEGFGRDGGVEEGHGLNSLRMDTFVFGSCDQVFG